MRNLYVGIDWGNTKSRIFAINDQGAVVRDDEVLSLSAEDWRAVFGALKKQGFQIKSCFEIGPQYEWLYDLLMEFCVEVTAINPADFALISKSQRKTDKVDARKLAEGLRRGDLPSVYVPEKAVREDRRLVAFIHWHSQQLTGVKIKVRALLLTHRLKCPYSNVAGVKGLEWLEREARPNLGAQSELFLELLLEQIKTLIEQRKKLDAQIKARLKKYGADAEIVNSVPGIGDLGTLAIISSIVSILRFRRPEELASYFGVCGGIHQSGDTLILKGITKRGNKHVRWLLSQALQNLHKKDPKARRRYERLKRRKKRGVARGAQVRWLTNILWQMLTKKEKYRVSGVGKQLEQKQLRAAKSEARQTRKQQVPA